MGRKGNWESNMDFWRWIQPTHGEYEFVSRWGWWCRRMSTLTSIVSDKKVEETIEGEINGGKGKLTRCEPTSKCWGKIVKIDKVVDQQLIYFQLMSFTQQCRSRGSCINKWNNYGGSWSKTDEPIADDIWRSQLPGTFKELLEDDLIDPLAINRGFIEWVGTIFFVVTECKIDLEILYNSCFD